MSKPYLPGKRWILLRWHVVIVFVQAKIVGRMVLSYTLHVGTRKTFDWGRFLFYNISWGLNGIQRRSVVRLDMLGSMV